MLSKDVREKFMSFFEARGHKRIAPAPLVLENDSTTLFTSSGMQPLVPYLMGELHPLGKRLVDSQPSIRLQDIEEVGDNRHTTFFEMLGNWSLGDYFKKEQLPWFFEFLTKELDLPSKQLWVSVFEGSDQVPKDTESIEIWKKIGIPESRIFQYGVKKNWWSRSGTPQDMPVGEIGGPDSEVFFDFGEDLKLHEKSPFKDEKCHPNCDCGRFIEIGNSVFIQYKKISDTKLEELPQKNVDFGGGFERILAAVKNTPDVFKTDLFSGVISEIEDVNNIKYGESEEKDRSMRIVAEHTRAAIALINNDIMPGNKLQGYILRRLIRRALLHLRQISKSGELTLPAIDLTKFGIPTTTKPLEEVITTLLEEVERFKKVMDKGIQKLNSVVLSKQQVNGEMAFDLYQSYGFPLELTLEFLDKNGLKFTTSDKKQFEKEFDGHKEKSRTTSAGVFKGGLADNSPEVVRLHTATHLLLAALRKVIGEHVVQKGQNITRDRSRFDFPNPDKLSDEKLKEVEDMINGVIGKSLPVSFEVMPKEQAFKTGAIHAFNEKYVDTVKVYFVGKSLKEAFSKEFCGGPHVSNTKEIGRVKIKKQEKIGAGLVRIYLTLAQ